MRSSLVGLQLLLAFVLVRGTSVEEEKKECCGPGVPPEKSCCPKDNSTSQEPEKEEEEPVVPAESNSEELEERGKEYRKRMQKTNRSPYEAMFLKEQALVYFNKRNTDAFYRPIEDINIKVKRATGTILTFTQFLVNTNCTKEEGRKFSTPWYQLERSTETVPCVALQKPKQRKLKCRVYMFLDARSRHSTVIRQDCEPVMFWDGSETDDSMDLDHLLDFPHNHFDPFF